MTTLKPYTDAFQPPTAEPPWLTQQRQSALDEAGALTLPTRRQESWRFTNLRPLEEGFYPPIAGGGAPDAHAVATYAADANAYRLSLANGRRHALSLGDTLGAPRFVLAATSIAAAGLLDGKLGLGDAGAGQPFVALNDALFSDGYTLIVPAKTLVDRPVEILHWGDSADPASIHTRNVVELAPGSSVTLIESFAGRRAYWRNDVTLIRLGEGATLRHIRLQDESPSALHIASTRIALAAKSKYEGFTLTLGGQLSRQDFVATIAGDHAECALNGAYLLRGQQEATIATFVDHAAPGGQTRETFKGVVGDRAHGVFQGKIAVRQTAQKTDARQLNKNLLLSPRAAVDTKPELEIFADDVKCSHGATVGDLDPAQLFYLVSRGIPEAAARRMLIEAFAADALDLVTHTGAKAYLQRHLQRWLAHSEEP